MKLSGKDDARAAFIVDEAVALGFRFAVDRGDLIAAYPRPPLPRAVATQFSRAFSDNRPAIVRYVAKRIAEAAQ
jgi:hypothetical protein